MNKEGNPVPSLDLEHYKKFLIKRGFTNNGPIMYAHLNPLKAYLKQYGVETNKEQPKCHTCKKVIGTWRGDNIQGSSKGYYSCDDCFSKVWAGEN